MDNPIEDKRLRLVLCGIIPENVEFADDQPRGRGGDQRRHGRTGTIGAMAACTGDVLVTIIMCVITILFVPVLTTVLDTSMKMVGDITGYAVMGIIICAALIMNAITLVCMYVNMITSVPVAATGMAMVADPTHPSEPFIARGPGLAFRGAQSGASPLDLRHGAT